jgi:hypothetical protein
MAGRAQYTVQVGKKEITFEGPSGLNEAQIEQLADTHLKNAMPGQEFPHSQLVGPDSQEHSVAVICPTMLSSTLTMSLRRQATRSFLEWPRWITLLV